jgi:hypothetical protein
MIPHELSDEDMKQIKNEVNKKFAELQTIPEESDYIKALNVNTFFDECY